MILKLSDELIVLVEIIDRNLGRESEASVLYTGGNIVGESFFSDKERCARKLCKHNTVPALGFTPGQAPRRHCVRQGNSFVGEGLSLLN